MGAAPAEAALSDDAPLVLQDDRGVKHQSILDGRPRATSSCRQLTEGCSTQCLNQRVLSVAFDGTHDRLTVVSLDDATRTPVENCHH